MAWYWKDKLPTPQDYDEIEEYGWTKYMFGIAYVHKRPGKPRANLIYIDDDLRVRASPSIIEKNLRHLKWVDLKKNFPSYQRKPRPV